MPNFRRFYIADAVIFITCVTKDRARLLEDTEDVAIFMETIKAVQELHPFHLLAYSILPDHFHWLMRVEGDKPDFSPVLQSVKRNYTLNYKITHGITASFSVWQPRFWDHVIRNEEDLSKHFDYIHWNPVKHGYVKNPEDWQYSTYQHWYDLKYYPSEWGRREEPHEIIGMNFE
jgi:putative transposase